MNPLHLVDQALDSLSPEIRRRCLLYLSGICDRQNLLPKSLSIPLCCDLKETPQDASENVRKGRYNGQEVAAKVLRVPTSGLEQTRKVGCPQLARIVELIMSHTAVLQGGCNMEEPSSSKHPAAIGHHND